MPKTGGSGGRGGVPVCFCGWVGCGVRVGSALAEVSAAGEGGFSSNLRGTYSRDRGCSGALTLFKPMNLRIESVGFWPESDWALIFIIEARMITKRVSQNKVFTDFRLAVNG